MRLAALHQRRLVRARGGVFTHQVGNGAEAGVGRRWCSSASVGRMASALCPVASIAVSTASKAPTLSHSDARTLQQRIDRIFDAAAPGGGPGCVVGVQRGGELLFRGAYGLASLELAVPLTPRSRFRIASVSKQFTVTAVLMLAAQGRLRLDDEVHAHVPELAPLPLR